MMLIQGRTVQFMNPTADTVRVPQVQIATGGDKSRIPEVFLDGEDGRLPQVQLGTGDVSRVPKVQISGLAAWFKFNYGITSSTSLVSQWDDQSGNGRHLKQGTDTNKPTVQADGSILFDGADNYLACDAFTLNQPTTVYVLGKQVTWTANDRFFDGNTANSMTLFQRTGSPNLAIFSGTTLGNNGNLALDTYGVISSVFNGANSRLQINNGTPVSGDAGSSNAGGFYLGALATPANFGNVQIKEVLIFSVAHDATQRAAIVRYLSTVGDL